MKKKRKKLTKERKKRINTSPILCFCTMPVDQIPMWRMAAQGQWLFQTVLQETQSSTGSELSKSLVYAKDRRILRGNNLGINESQDFSFLRIVASCKDGMLNILDFVIIDPQTIVDICLFFVGRFDLVSFGQDPGIPLALGFLDLCNTSRWHAQIENVVQNWRDQHLSRYG